ncbi:MAG TPA: BtrH N-terminal domain-containing protein [Anaerolineales bacterium]|nr:BtrH N-terminal domain-containing protein [Anaerolineales bacterium]
MTILSNYNHFDGFHYETGSLHNVLAYQGLKMPHTKSAPSEALLLGLSGGITFGYFSFAYKGIDPHVALLTRNTFDPFETMLNRLGAVRNLKQTVDPVKAEKNLLDALEDGQPALVWADRISMPYSNYDGSLGSDMYMMIPVVVYGVEPSKGMVWVADQSRAALRVPFEDFTKARGRVKKEKYRLMTITVPGFDRLAQNVDAAIRACVKSFFTSPVKGYASNFGFAAYQRWADVLFNEKDKQSWNKIFPAGRNMFAGLTSSFERIELFGSGGSASRPMFADFLEEASVLLNRPALRDAAKQFRAVAPAWQSLCLALLPDSIAPFKEARQLMLQKRDAFYGKGGGASAEIKRVNARLEKIRTAVDKKFPLAGEKETAFKENLRDHILQVYDLEHKAVTALDQAMR